MTVIRDTFDPDNPPTEVEIGDLPLESLVALIEMGDLEAAAELVDRLKSRVTIQ